jgi:ribosomal protein S18 acetylase RimI-like enzyme
VLDALDPIEAYYDAVPRTVAIAHDVGPFTLFVNDGPGWSYYARPRLGTQVISVADVQLVLARQREIGVPQSIEWMHEATPNLVEVARTASLSVSEYPLLVLDRIQPLRPPSRQVTVRKVLPTDDIGLIGSVGRLAFATPYGAPGTAGVEELKAIAADRAPAAIVFERGRIASGRTVMAAAFVDDMPVAVGVHQPIGSVTEVAGIGTLPAYRGLGLASAITTLLVEDAVEAGDQTVFLSAANLAVARLYERLGFGRIATACVAGPAPEASGVGR